MRLAALGSWLVLTAVFAPAATAKTVWLCHPTIRPCAPGLSTTTYTPAGAQLSAAEPYAVKKPPIDCFYVYPTVSTDTTVHSDRKIGVDEVSIALTQASRFSQLCRVFAPMYRQVTLQTLATVGAVTPPRLLRLPIADVRRAFRTYLKRYNHGRGFVLIGHSQGTEMLREMAKLDIDLVPAVRRRLVSALLIGERVLVRRGRDAGGDFARIRACRSPRQLHCVISYSTYDTPPPADSVFGRAPAGTGTAVLCTNPAALGGGAGTLDPIFLSPGPGQDGEQYPGLVLPTPPTVWLTEPGAYRAGCSGAGGAHVLRVVGLGGAQNPEPFPDATWGLHLLDVNLALGNLLGIVRSESAAYSG